MAEGFMWAVSSNGDAEQEISFEESEAVLYRGDPSASNSPLAGGTRAVGLVL